MSFDERIDEDESAVSGDTRIRVRENGADFVLVREQYKLVEFETGAHSDTEQEGDSVGSDEADSANDTTPKSFERYDWSVDDRFTLHGDTEAKQVTAELERLDAFDAEILFHRQIWSGDERPEPCPTDDAE